MNVYILTQPLGHNYGGILQNYALQQILIRKGFSPLTVFMDNPLMGRCSRCCYDILYGMFSLIKYGNWKNLDELKRICDRPLQKFVDRNIRSTECFHTPKALKSFFRQHQKDSIIIVGSDQVWRPQYSPCLPVFFCAFAPMKTIPHLAYAASFGVNECEFSASQRIMAKKALPYFKGVSVREKNAVQMCRDFFDCHEAILVPDPTLLLEADEYRRLFEAVNFDDQPALTCYFLDYSDAKKSVAERFARKNGNIPVASLIPLLPENHALHQKLVKPTVSKWLRDMSCAKYVMTDSFHGTVFSVLFHRQFIVTGNMKRGNARIKDLLADLGLSERLIDVEDYQSAAEILKTPVDYDKVEQKLMLLKERGLRFLDDNLCQK